MNNTVIKKIAIGVIALIMFLLVALAVPFPKDTAAYWTSLAFGVLALLVLAYTFYTSTKGGTAMSKFYGFPLIRVGVIYACVQIILSFTVMALGFAFEVPVWIPLLVFLLLLSAGLIGLLQTDVIRDFVEAQDAKVKANVYAMRELQGRLPVIAGQCADPETKAALTALAEKVRYSDPVSCEAVAALEGNLSALADALRNAVAGGNNAAAQQLAAQMETVLAERNRLCKLNK